MKKILILNLLMFSLIISSAQTSFFDAKNLKDNIPNSQALSKKILFRPSTMEQIILFNSVFKNYFPDSATWVQNDSALFQIIRRQLINNPFIEVAGTQQDASILANVSKTLSSGGLFSFGTSSATIIADGIGKFLAKRTKQELNVLFFDRFREFLDTHPEIAQIFPSTTILLNSILNQEYPNLLSTLRAAFDSDLKAILKNIAAIADIDSSACNKCNTDKKKETCKNRLLTIQKILNGSNQGRALVAGLLIADGVISKQNPADILSTIVGNNTIQTVNVDLYNSLKLLNVFSESLRSDKPSEIWIDHDELNAMVNDPVLLNIYLGLIYQQVSNKQIQIGGQFIASTYLTQANISGLKNYIDKIGTAGKKLELSFKELKESETDSISVRLIESGKFVGDVHSFFDIAIQYNTINSSIPPPGNSAKQIFLYVDTSLSVVQKILAKEYYGAILSTTVMLENLLKTRADFNSAGQLLSDIKAEQDIALRKKQFLRSFLRYTNFAANVVAAENSDAVEKSIEAIALPPGSASIKRTTNFNIAFQAYTGFVGGDIKGEKGTFNSVSVYAPVGLAFSLGLRPGFWPRSLSRRNPENKRSWGSLSLFGSIIDVGAFVSYRFFHPDEKLSDSVNIAWSNIFAPGVNIVYGIPKWPLSIGFGAQYQASLRKVDAATATVVEKSGLRYNFFLALDLPVLNLYTSKR